MASDARAGSEKDWDHSHLVRLETFKSPPKHDLEAAFQVCTRTTVTLANNYLLSTQIKLLSVDHSRVVVRENNLIVGVADGVVPSSDLRPELIYMAA
jgi:hypothetical protein